MHERDLQAEQAPPRLLVDQLRTFGGQPLERTDDVVDLVRDVMHPRAPLREELADRRIAAERREQLDPALPEPHRRRFDALVLDPFPMLEPTAEEALVRRDSGIEVLDGDADVMNRACLHPGDATAAYAMLAV